MSNTDPNQTGGGAGQQAQIFCPNCRGGNAPEATTCRWCGQPLTGAATMPIGQPQAQPGPTAGQPTQAQPQYQQQTPMASSMPPDQTPMQQAHPMPENTVPPSYQPPPAVTAPPPKKSNMGRILLVCGGIALLGAIICAVLFGTAIMAAIGLTQPAADAAERFMVALRDDNYDQAYNMLTSDVQQEVGNAAGLESALSVKQPTTWTFTNRNVQNDTAEVSGTATFTDGTNGPVVIVLQKVGNDWKIAGANLDE